MKTKVMLIFALFISGCGYSTQSIYRQDIKTVCLEMFDSETFDRQIEFELSSALAKKIELLTPYKVVADRSTADSIISGQIKSTQSNIVSQQRELDRPIQQEVIITVEVSWQALRGPAAKIIDKQQYTFYGDQNNIAGISRSAAISQAVDKIADEIVVSMTAKW
jgi:hypothetical protein